MQAQKTHGTAARRGFTTRSCCGGHGSNIFPRRDPKSPPPRRIDPNTASKVGELKLVSGLKLRHPRQRHLQQRERGQGLFRPDRVNHDDVPPKPTPPSVITHVGEPLEAVRKAPLSARKRPSSWKSRTETTHKRPSHGSEDASEPGTRVDKLSLWRPGRLRELARVRHAPEVESSLLRHLRRQRARQRRDAARAKANCSGLTDNDSSRDHAQGVSGRTHGSKQASSGALRACVDSPQLTSSRTHRPVCCASQS